MSSFGNFSMNSKAPLPSHPPVQTETGDLLLSDFTEDQKKYIVRELYPLLKQSLLHVSVFFA